MKLLSEIATFLYMIIIILLRAGGSFHDALPSHVYPRPLTDHSVSAYGSLQHSQHCSTTDTTLAV